MDDIARDARMGLQNGSIDPLPLEMGGNGSVGALT